MNQGRLPAKYGPWAVVTGASDGIGRAFAEHLAQHGMNLVLVARRADRLHALAEELSTRHGVAITTLSLDLGTVEGQRELTEATASVNVGLLVASAGYGTSGPVLEADLLRERDMLEVNCYAVLEQAVVFGKRFAERGGGGVILLSSLVGWQGVPMSAHYAATKAYVQSLAEALRIEWKPQHVDVLAVAPGPVSSGFAARANMVMGAAVLPEAVARASIKALGRKGTVIPGSLSKLLTYSLMPLPRWARSKILAGVMGGMTKHQRMGSTAS